MRAISPGRRPLHDPIFSSLLVIGPSIRFTLVTVKKTQTKFIRYKDEKLQQLISFHTCITSVFGWAMYRELELLDIRS